MAEEASTIDQSLTPTVTAPSRTRPDDFATEGDAFLAWMETHGGELITWTTQANALSTNVNTNAVAAETAATNAQTAESNIDAFIQAEPYNAGTTYQVGDSCIGSDGIIYRRINTSGLGDDPVGSVTGNWHNTEISAFTLLNAGAVGTNQTYSAQSYNYVRLEPTADITIDITNIDAGSAIMLELLGAGDHTITWNAEGAELNIVWDEGNAPTLATGTDSTLVGFVSPDGTKLYSKTIYAQVA